MVTIVLGYSLPAVYLLTYVGQFASIIDNFSDKNSTGSLSKEMSKFDIHGVQICSCKFQHA